MEVKNDSREAKRRARAERDRHMDEKLLADFRDPEKRKKRRRNVRIGFCVTLAILLVASLINWGVVSSWGKVSIQRINLSGNDGATTSALVYRPANATDKTPAPTLICFHGNAGNARNHESWAMEFARRGFVVVSPDLYGSGDSLGYFDGSITSGNGTFPGAQTARSLLDEADIIYQYVLSLPYVDDSNVVTAGHSMGASAAELMGAKYSAKAIIGASPVTVPTVNDSPEMQDWSNYQGNYIELVGIAELSTGMHLQEPLAVLQTRPGYEDVTEVEPGKLYGSFDEGNAFIYVEEPYRIHEAAFVSTTTIGNLLKYAQEAVGDAVPNYIDSNDQVWPLKDYTGLFGIFAFAAFLFAFALLLIEEVPASAAVRRPLARNIGFRGTGLVIVSLIALLVPYLVIKTDAFGIVGGRSYTNLYSAGFNLGFSNMGFGVVIGLAIVCAIGLIVFIATERKKKGLKLADFGMAPYGYEELQTRGQRVRSVIGMILRSLAVATITIAVGWALLQLQVNVLGTDFYAWFFGVKDIPMQKIPYYLNYLGVFILCFIVLSIDMNVIRRLPTTGNETKDLVIAMAVNIALGIAMVIIIVAVKWHLQSIASPADTNWLWDMGLDTQRIWGLPVGMTVATAGSTFIYKKTGNLWLCALLVGTVACLMGVLYGSTRFHYLTFFYG